MAGSTGGIRLVSGKDRVRFADVIKSFKGWTTLLRVSLTELMKQLYTAA